MKDCPGDQRKTRKRAHRKSAVSRSARVAVKRIEALIVKRKKGEGA